MAAVPYVPPPDIEHLGVELRGLHPAGWSVYNSKTREPVFGIQILDLHIHIDAGGDCTAQLVLKTPMLSATTYEITITFADFLFLYERGKSLPPYQAVLIKPAELVALLAE